MSKRPLEGGEPPLPAKRADRERLHVIESQKPGGESMLRGMESLKLASAAEVPRVRRLCPRACGQARPPSSLPSLQPSDFLVRHQNKALLARLQAYKRQLAERTAAAAEVDRSRAQLLSATHTLFTLWRLVRDAMISS